MQTMLTSADVVALYPSIRLEEGMIALQWFMDHHTDFNPTLNLESEGFMPQVGALRVDKYQCRV